ncbi:MAG: hypothetical protein WDM89_16845 [Rhizomicrobium sp.]
MTGEDVGGAYTSVYWDLDTSGQKQGCGEDTNCNGVTGLSDTQLKSDLPAGFEPNIWKEKPGTNGGYPYLIDNPPPQ